MEFSEAVAVEGSARQGELPKVANANPRRDPARSWKYRDS
jgi:hypothetical protein